MIVLVLIPCMMVLKFAGLGSLVGVWKRVRPNRKTPAHLVSQGFLGSLSLHRVWKRVGICGQRSSASDVAKKRRLHQQAEVLLHVQDRMGVG